MSAKSEKQTLARQFTWLDLVKAVALTGIFLNHLVERIFGYPEIANPRVGWPAFSARFEQLRPLTDHGILNAPINLLRWTGWFGEHGVELFLIVSGFGLTWGLLARYGNKALPLRDFYFRRAERIYPLWWGAHLAFMALWLLTGLGLSMADPATYMSFLGIRVTPYLLYYFTPAWWYIGLLLQLYLVYPLLWEALRRWSPGKLLIASCGIGIAARAVGSLIFTNYLEAWLRGAIFITRLPEFVFGISLAAWMFRDPQHIDARMRAPSTIILALAACLVSFPLALTLLGMAVVPFLLGAGMLVLLYVVLRKIKNSKRGIVGLGSWVGRHSYSLYIVHHPCVQLFIPKGPAVSGKRAVVGFFIAVIAMAISALLLELVVKRVLMRLGRWKLKVGTLGAAARVAVIVAGVALVLAAGDLAVRRFAPQEVLGWGERASLEPDPVLGWRLKPSRTTRLRWEGYDYTVTSNSLGFPGPEYPELKEPGVIRVMTVGDAFTSAEGVNTDQAWPRLLEADLAQGLPGQRVEVLNFGITGFGPIQYALVFEKYAPVYRPDLLIIGFFVNEYEDVSMNVEKFRDSIGFDLPSQDSWRSIAQFAQLRSFIKLELRQPLMELVVGKPRDHGYFLGNFSALEKGRTDINVIGRQRVAEHLERIKAVADRIGAKVLIAMIPASVQVCGPAQLAYYPKPVDLTDSERFDMEQPQRMTRGIASSLGIAYHDLRAVLKSVAGGCAYHPKNMHWTVDGHKAVAEDLARTLISDPDILLRR
ncbi:MAG: acyltransferase family protein [Candidatus Aminicenantales bacterium]